LTNSTKSTTTSALKSRPSSSVEKVICSTMRARRFTLASSKPDAIW